MTDCESVRDRVDRYVAGDLDAEQRAAVDRHLTGCADCRDDLESSRVVASHTTALRREINPANDLWAGIAARLRPRRRELSLPVSWLAAAAVALVVGSAAMTRVIVRSEPATGGFAALEGRYQEAALELDNLMARTRDSLAPETRLVLERNLVVIERALGEARAALDADPANRLLEGLLLAAYQRKIAFLERATALGRTS